jgi:murein hydrolase activator
MIHSISPLVSLRAIKKSSKFCLLLLFITFSTIAASQTKKELEKKKEELRKEIEYTNKLLNEVQKNKQATLSTLTTLKRKISARVELIRTINQEINLYNDEIDNVTDEIRELEQEIMLLKEEYAKMIYFAYVNQNAYQRLAFIFASHDFNQAYKRIKYLQQYGAYRQEQAKQIEKKQQDLIVKKEKLELEKQQKSQLLSSEEKERKLLDSERNEQLSMISKLQDSEKNLKKKLKEKQQAEAKLNKAIENIIKKEIEAARRKALAAGKKDVTASNALSMTPEAARLSANFAGNRGKLPWPVEQGVITGTFGEHPHPVLAGIKTKNNGIDINTKKGAVARAIFDGEVTGVVIIPGSNKAVIVRHGEYLSVYSNLDEVYVRMGEKVTIKQPLGLVHSNEEDSKTELHLEIWQNTTKLNPATWLYMRK